MNRHLLGKNFHANPKDKLKHRCHPKIILGHAVLNYCLNQLFS